FIVDLRLFLLQSREPRRLVELAGQLVDRLLGTLGHMAGKNVMVPFAVILVGLDRQEYKGERCRANDPVCGQLILLQAHRLVRQHDEYARGDQNKRVDASGPDADMCDLRIGRPAFGAQPQHDVSADEGREEHDLGAEEKPHPQFSIGNRHPHLQRRDVRMTGSVNGRSMRHFKDTLYDNREKWSHTSVTRSTGRYTRDVHKSRRAVRCDSSAANRTAAVRYARL